MVATRSEQHTPCAVVACSVCHPCYLYSSAVSITPPLDRRARHCGDPPPALSHRQHCTASMRSSQFICTSSDLLSAAFFPARLKSSLHPLSSCLHPRPSVPVSFRALVAISTTHPRHGRCRVLRCNVLSASCSRTVARCGPAPVDARRTTRLHLSHTQLNNQCANHLRLRGV